MVRLDVELHVFLEPVLADEVETSRRVEIVLMLRRLLRLGLEQELPLESDRLGEIDRQMHEPGQVIQFAFHIGVVEIGIPFTASPENIIGTPQLMGDFDRLFDLGGRVGEDVGIGARGGPMHVPRMREQIGRPPQQLDSGAFLGGLQMGHDRVEVAIGRHERRPVRRDVPVVKAVKRRAELRHELEGRVHAPLGVLDRFAAVVPGPQKRRRPNGSAPVARKVCQ